MVKYYFDTCIWRDFYEERFSKSGRSLGKVAERLFWKVLKNKDKILFSETLIWELKKAFGVEEINDMLNLLFVNNVLVRIEILKEEISEAKKLSKERNLPLVDCLNAVQARNHNAILISQDNYYFQLSDIVNFVKPG